MTAAEHANRIAAAKAHLAATMDAAGQFALEQLAAGVPEAVVARELGVHRLTVRRWQGK